MTAASPPAVILEGVSKTYGILTAVRGVSLAVGKGELMTLLGPSGCGKTTILRIIAGFVRPTSGIVRIAGDVVNNLPPHCRRVGLVFQNYALFPHLTAGENVAFGLRMRGIERNSIQARVNEVLERVRLAERIDAYPRQLSGGQQQRVALARALVIEPDILLLDEPFGALDRELRQHMQSEMRRLQRSYGISTLLVTHDQEEALTLSDRIAVMNAGTIEQTGTAADVFERPQTRFVAEFMGRANVFTGQVRRTGSSTAKLGLVECGMEVSLSGECQACGGDVMVLIRPERIMIQRDDTRCVLADPGVGGPFSGRIIETSYYGAMIEIRVATGARAKTVLVVRSPAPANGSGSFAPGDTVLLTLPREAIHIISSSERREIR
jgi:putative spermidine/putrescine transport system ATP-binding protein